VISNICSPQVDLRFTLGRLGCAKRIAMSIHRHILTALPLSLVLMSCTTPSATEMAASAEAEKPDLRRGEEVRRVCFGSSISGFQKATRTSVVLSRGSKDYLVTTRNRCPDLQYSNSLALRSYSGCLTRGDKLIGFDTPFGRNTNGPPSIACYIDKIYEWNEDAAESEPAADTETPEEA